MPLEAELYPVGGSGPTVELLLVLRLGPPGIDRVTVTDARGLPVSGVPPVEGCPEDVVELRLPPISTYRLPLFVRAVECETGDEHERGPLLEPRPVPDPDPTGGGVLGCTSTYTTPPTAACVSAAAAVREARAAAVAQCDRNEDMKHERDRQRDWATRLWVAAGAALAAAIGALLAGSWIGAILAAVLFGVAAALTYAAIVAFGLAERWDARLAEGRQRFRELRDQFEYDASDIECDA